MRVSRRALEKGKSSRCRTIGPAALLLGASLLGGCLSRPELVSQSFAFALPLKPVSRPLSGPVLTVRRLNVAAPFAGQAFVYRTGQFSYEQDPYAQFLVPPDQGLAEPVRAWLRSSDRYRAVTEPGSVVKPSVLMEVFVPELYGDFRDRAAPRAVLSMRFVFLDAAEHSSGRVLASRTVSRRVPLRARTAAALMAGWDQALKEIMQELAAQPPTSLSSASLQ